MAIRVWVLVTRRRPIISIYWLTGERRDTKQRRTDAASQEAIRQHLAMIAEKFSQGDFAIPMFIHATVPPGVETMKQLKSKIIYEAENTERGAQLRITTHDAEALIAITAFSVSRFRIIRLETPSKYKSRKNLQQSEAAGFCQMLISLS